MNTFFPLLAIVASGMVCANEANQPTKFCTEAGCDSDCPVTLTSAGTGYPNCVVYESDNVFPDYGFATSEGGGYMPFIDVPDQDHDCQLIVKSPADTTVAGCGAPIGSFPRAACAALTLQETFMVQFCCGVGDCTAAGAQQSGKRSGSGSGGLYLKYANGTIIQPKQDAPMLLDAPAAKLQRSSRPASLVARSACTEDSWVADPDEDDYTRPADSSQVIFTGIAGGQMVMLMHERSASYTQSLSTSLGFADILSLGVEFSSSMTEETSDSTTRSFQAPPGQSGNVVFTAILRCSTGTGTCNDGSLHGEICTGQKDDNGEIIGTYTVVVTD